MTYDADGYRERWTVQCADLFGQSRRMVIAPARHRSALLVAMPASTVYLTARQAEEMASDLVGAARRNRADGERMESK